MIKNSFDTIYGIFTQFSGNSGDSVDVLLQWCPSVIGPVGSFHWLRFEPEFVCNDDSSLSRFQILLTSNFAIVKK